MGWVGGEDASFHLEQEGTEALGIVGVEGGEEGAIEGGGNRSADPQGLGFRQDIHGAIGLQRYPLNRVWH